MSAAAARKTGISAVRRGRSDRSATVLSQIHPQGLSLAGVSFFCDVYVLQAQRSQQIVYCLLSPSGLPGWPISSPPGNESAGGRPGRQSQGGRWTGRCAITWPDGRRETRGAHADTRKDNISQQRQVSLFRRPFLLYTPRPNSAWRPKSV